MIEIKSKKKYLTVFLVLSLLFSLTLVAIPSLIYAPETIVSFDNTEGVDATLNTLSGEVSLSKWDK